MKFGQHGFTLIELLATLVISSIILLMVGITYQAIIIGGTRANTTVDMQINARNALALMTKDISASGFMLNGLFDSSQCATGKLTESAVAGTGHDPVLVTQQTVNGNIPNTSIKFGYATNGSSPTESLTVFLADETTATQCNSSSAPQVEQVTYSIQMANGTPSLFRTVVKNGSVIENSSIASNVVYMYALFAPLNNNGSIGKFISWQEIKNKGDTGNIGAVEFSIVTRRRDVGNRRNTPSTVDVPGATWQAGQGYYYQVYTRTVYLQNVAWNGS